MNPFADTTDLPPHDRARPWASEGPGQWCCPLAFLPGGAGWVELMRLEPGVRVPLHRHTGEVHAWNLAGQRQLSDGRRVGPGEHVFEPAGNVDAWEAVGPGPLVVLVVVTGTVEYLAPDGAVARVVSTASRIADHRRWCADHGAPCIATEET